jgi:hypothetical protein
VGERWPRIAIELPKIAVYEMESQQLDYKHAVVPMRGGKPCMSEEY